MVIRKNRGFNGKRFSVFVLYPGIRRMFKVDIDTYYKIDRRIDLPLMPKAT